MLFGLGVDGCLRRLRPFYFTLPRPPRASSLLRAAATRVPAASGACWRLAPSGARGQQPRFVFTKGEGGSLLSDSSGYDPSAGSPTKTLLRLLLPLNDQVWTSFRRARGDCASAANDPKRRRGAASREAAEGAGPTPSLNHSIGSSDGRCVQRAGT